MGGDFDGDPLAYFKAKAVQSVDFFGIVCEQAEGFTAQVPQNLSANPVFTQIRLEAQFYIRLNRVQALFLQFVGLELVD